MSSSTLQLDDTLRDYLLSVSLRDDDIAAALRQETSELTYARMQISPEQGQLLHWLVRALSTTRAIEIGTFTGYSALCIARALPDDGQLLCLDINDTWTAIAQRYWEQAQLGSKIELRLGQALETLHALDDTTRFDFAFIDADKGNYIHYYERLLDLMDPGAVIAFDNVLWGGAVADPDNQEPDTIALRELNTFLFSDARVDISMIPIGDGLTLARLR